MLRGIHAVFYAEAISLVTLLLASPGNQKGDNNERLSLFACFLKKLSSFSITAHKRPPLSPFLITVKLMVQFWPDLKGFWRPQRPSFQLISLLRERYFSLSSIVLVARGSIWWLKGCCGCLQGLQWVVFHGWLSAAQCTGLVIGEESCPLSVVGS